MENLPAFFNEEQLLIKWEEIGLKNKWISEAYDPVFSKERLEKCYSLTELHSYLIFTGWCLGQGFYFQNLCFVNQRDGGDEWLAIKNDQVFDSISFWQTIQEGRFYTQMERYLVMTVTHQLNRL